MIKIVEIDECPNCHKNIHAELAKKLFGQLAGSFFEYECSCGALLEVDVVPIPEFNVSVKELPKVALKDPLLPQAKEVSTKHGFVSLSYMQRTLRIGYCRAARLIDLLIEEGFCEGGYEPETYCRKIIQTNDANLEDAK
jgi:DNA segregation ATPase FtsK/SpoIIIE-like protein